MSDAADANVIVVGGGPAGVGAAIALRRSGVERVVLLDRERELGGSTRHCSHSPFGMLEYRRIYFGAAYGRRLQAEAMAAGVDVRTGHSVVELGREGDIIVSSKSGVETLAARRILLATGAREEPRSARLLPGDRPVGVLTTGALQAYVAFEKLMPFRRPVILGSELVSLSALLTCLGHGARPVALVEQVPHLLARRPLTLFPRIMGVPVFTGAEVVDIHGEDRVESITIRTADGERVLECDGLLLTGHFTPEATLFRSGDIALDRATSGPAVDQHGRSLDPRCFAAGNVLRPVETGGWSFREGRSIGEAIAHDLAASAAMSDEVVPVEASAPIRLVVPQMLRRGAASIPAALRFFQLRMERRAHGDLALVVDGKTVWRRNAFWLPERRILVPIPEGAERASHIMLSLEEK